jgi:pimeloyl-ACP methyl ester carboxylesterase
VRRCKEAIVKN